MLTLAFAAFLAFAQDAPRTLPNYNVPMRNTFVTAAETVIDNANAVDIHGDDTRFNAQMAQLKASRETLKGMTEDDREKDVASATDDLIFAISSCRIPAKNGAETTACEAKMKSASLRAMEALGKHKSADGKWQDGPPTR
jgi:hypothetical protein